MQRKNVLITFARSYLTLDLARLLHAAGHRVTVADSMPFPVSRFSNAVDAFVRVPPPRYQPRAWGAALARVARERDIDVVIPMHEETEILGQLADLFPPGCRVFAADPALEDQLTHKYEFQRALDARGIPTLKYALVTSQADFDALDFDVPFALKQVYSRASLGVFKVAPGDPCPVREWNAANPWLAQRWLAGTRYCTYSVVDDGIVLAHATYPIEYTIDGNSCITFSEVKHPGIARWVAEFLAGTGYTGQVGFDFIEDPDEGLFTIECNPRSTSGVMMFAPGDGVDEAFLGGGASGEPVEPPTDRHKMIGPGMLIYGWRRSNRPAGRSLLGFVRDYWRTDDVITSRRDLRPALALPLAYVAILDQCRRYGVGLAEGFMHDHEWHGGSVDDVATGAGSSGERASDR